MKSLKTSLKWSLLSLTAFVVMACAFDKNSDVDRERELRDRQKADAEYQDLIGVYEGTFTTVSTVQNIELRFYMVNIPDGRNSNNLPKYRRALIARFQQENVVEDSFMEVSYIRERGEILMSNGEGTLSATGRLANGVITGVVTKNGGVLGKINVHLVSREAPAPSENDQAERNERARRIYNTVTGTYYGTFKVRPQEGPSFDAMIKISIGEKEETEKNLVPFLTGYFRRSDDISGERELILNIDYQANLSPAVITFATSKDKNPNAIYTIAISGTVTNGVITGRFSDQRGIQGEVLLRKR